MRTCEDISSLKERSKGSPWIYILFSLPIKTKLCDNYQFNTIVICRYKPYLNCLWITFAIHWFYQDLHKNQRVKTKTFHSTFIELSLFTWPMLWSSHNVRTQSIPVLYKWLFKAVVMDQVTKVVFSHTYLRLVSFHHLQQLRMFRG